MQSKWSGDLIILKLRLAGITTDYDLWVNIRLIY